MIRKEYNNTDYTPTQINNAVEQIVANDKSDYKIEGYNPDSVMLLCRTGYNWSIITEVMWDKVDDQHVDVLIECRNKENSAATSHIQREYEERHIDKVTNLFFKYIDQKPSAVPVKKASSGKVVAIILGVIVIVAAAIVVFLFGNHR